MNATRLLQRTLIASAIGATVVLTACGKTDDGQTVGQKVDQSIATAEAKTSELKAEAKEGLAEAKASAEHAADSAAQKIDDAAVTATINAELVKDPALSAIKIDVDTQDGRVLLSGKAPTTDARDRATRIASAVKGVQSVDNRLVIGG